MRLQIPFFFKQWGGSFAANKARGHLLNGRVWADQPAGMPALRHEE